MSRVSASCRQYRVPVLSSPNHCVLELVVCRDRYLVVLSVPVNRHRGEQYPTGTSKTPGGAGSPELRYACFALNLKTSNLSMNKLNYRSSLSQSVSYFTVPPRAHPSTGSQSDSAAPVQPQVPSARSRGHEPGGSSIVQGQLSQVRSVSPSEQVIPVAFCPVPLGRDCVR